MLNFKDIFKTDISQMEETNSSLPIIIQLVQTTFNTTTLVPHQNPGTIGNQNMAFVIDLPTRPNTLNQEIATIDDKQIICPSFNKIQNVINQYKLLKFSRKEFHDLFYIYEIPDYSNQALSPGFLDFIPMVFTKNDDNTTYNKILQQNIGILRSYHNKKAYILIDKHTYIAPVVTNKPYSSENLAKISVLFKFKRYVNRVKTSSSVQKPENHSAQLIYDELTDTYSGIFRIKTSLLRESDFKRINFYITEKQSNTEKTKYKLHNNNIIQNLQIYFLNDQEEEIDVNSLVERQSDSNRDYYRIVMNLIYGRDNYIHNNIHTEQDNIAFKIQINNYLDIEMNDKIEGIDCVLESSRDFFYYKSKENASFKSISTDIDNFDQIYGIKYTVSANNTINSQFVFPISITSEEKDGETVTNIKGDLNKSFKNTEFFPIVNEDRIFFFKIKSIPSEGPISLNIHSKLSENFIYHPYLNLSEANILLVDSNGNYKTVTKSNGTISNLDAEDTLIISIDKHIPEITQDTTETTVVLYDIDDSTYQSDTKYKYTITQDPYLEYYNSNNSNVTLNISNYLQNNKEIFAYDGVVFDDLDSTALDNGEMRIKKTTFSINTGDNNYDDTVDNDRDPDAEQDRYILAGLNNINNSFVSEYAKDTGLLEYRLETAYNNTIKPIYKSHTDKIETSLDNVRKTFGYMFLNVNPNDLTEVIEDTTIYNTSYDGFLYLGFQFSYNELPDNKLFDLKIYYENDLIYTEYNCEPLQYGDKYIYIHLPFYLFNVKDSYTENKNLDDITNNNNYKINFECVFEDEDNTPSSIHYYFQK